MRESMRKKNHHDHRLACVFSSTHCRRASALIVYDSQCSYVLVDDWRGITSSTHQPMSSSQKLHPQVNVHDNIKLNVENEFICTYPFILHTISPIAVCTSVHANNV